MRALIVDDERIARQELRRLLTTHPAIEIAGEARNGEEALGYIERSIVDVLFLDIHMPGMDAFEFLEKLDEVPQVIFTTAYDSYALKAFDIGAIDYLVKPIAPERLAASIARLKPPAATLRLNRLFVKDNNRCWLVEFSDIHLLESEGNYTRLYFGKERPLIPRSLASLQERLDPTTFFRADRKHIINLKWVQSVAPKAESGLLVTLKNGLKVEMSRRQSAFFRNMLSP
jgi:two-component system LytT family response regulator